MEEANLESDNKNPERQARMTGVIKHCCQDLEPQSRMKWGWKEIAEPAVYPGGPGGPLKPPGGKRHPTAPPQVTSASLSLYTHVRVHLHTHPLPCGAQHCLAASFLPFLPPAAHAKAQDGRSFPRGQFCSAGPSVAQPRAPVGTCSV